MTANPSASAREPSPLVPNEVAAAENRDARQNMFFSDDPNPGLGQADHVQDPPKANAQEEEAPRTLTIREQIAERAKAARAAEREQYSEEDLSTNDMGEFVPPFVKKQGEEDAARIVADGEAKAKAQAEADNKTYTLKVRGNDVPVANRAELLKLAEVDDEDAGSFTDAALIKLAQKQMAASAILDEAKQLSKSARQAARDDSDDTLSDQEKAAKDRDERATDPAVDQGNKADWHRETIEKIQFGDPEEAAEALKNALNRGVKDALTQHQVSERINYVETAINRATDEFEAANADLFEDLDIADMVYNKAVIAEFKADLLAGGADPSKVDQVLGSNIATAMQAYVAVAASGRVKLRAPAAILNTAAEKVRTKINRPKPATEDADPKPRRDRLTDKRNLSPQPSRASVPHQVNAPKNGQTPEARSSVVAKMRQQRGQAA